MSHALLSPSASHRWIECPPSARLTEFLADTTSAYAAEGTAAHSIAEGKLNLSLGYTDKKPKCEDSDMDSYTDDYQLYESGNPPMERNLSNHQGELYHGL